MGAASASQKQAFAPFVGVASACQITTPFVGLALAINDKDRGRNICTQNSQCSAGRFCSQDGRCEKREVTPPLRPVCPRGEWFNYFAGACQPNLPWYDCSREQGAVDFLAQHIRDTCTPPEGSRKYVIPGHCPHLLLRLDRASKRLERCKEFNPEGTGGTK